MTEEIKRPYLGDDFWGFTPLQLPMHEHAVTEYSRELQIHAGYLPIARYTIEDFVFNVSIQFSCSPVEDQLFREFVNRFEALVQAIYPQVNSLGSGSHDSRPAGDVWRAAYYHYTSKEGWCLTNNNPDLPKFRRLENDLSTLYQRVVGVMKSNFRSYSNRITPLINNVLRECAAIGSSSFDATYVIDTIKQLINAEEEFHFGLVDDDLAGAVDQFNLLYKNLNVEVARAASQLLSNCSLTIGQAESYATDALSSFALIDHQDRDGQEQFEEGEQKFALYYAKIKEVEKYKLMDDASGRLDSLQRRYSAIIQRVKDAWAKLRRFQIIPSASGYDIYADHKKRYASLQLLDFIKRLNSEYSMNFRIGDMSYEHGGTVRFRDGDGAHYEHKFGLDVDMTCPAGGVMGQANYDKSEWIDFLTLCAKDSTVKKILFSDPAVVSVVNSAAGSSKVREVPKHGDHTHVSLD